MHFNRFCVPGISQYPPSGDVKDIWNYSLRLLRFVNSQAIWIFWHVINNYSFVFFLHCLLDAIMLFPLCEPSFMEGLAGYFFVALHAWWSGDHLELFFLSLSLGTTSQSVTNDATNAHCTGWQATVAAKPSITKKMVFEMLSTLVSSKHERVKVMELVWAHFRGHSANDEDALTSGKRESSLIHQMCIIHDLKKPFTWEVKHPKKCKEVQFPSSEVIKNKNGDYMMASLLFPVFFLENVL